MEWAGDDDDDDEETKISFSYQADLDRRNCVGNRCNLIVVLSHLETQLRSSSSRVCTFSLHGDSSLDVSCCCCCCKCTTITIFHFSSQMVRPHTHWHCRRPYQRPPLAFNWPYCRKRGEVERKSDFTGDLGCDTVSSISVVPTGRNGFVCR